MSAQLMIFNLKKNNKLLKEGIIEALGDSVFEMTEYVVEQLSERFNITKITFIDVSNTWSFNGFIEEEEDIILEFAPIGIYADKFGIDEEIN